MVHTNNQKVNEEGSYKLRVETGWDGAKEEIEAHNARGERTVFICPVGPVGQYPYFVDIVNERGISLKQVWFINMDEYLDDELKWVSMDHPLSFRGFMERAVYGRIKPELVMLKEQRVFPVTLLQNHSDITLTFTEYAANLID